MIKIRLWYVTTAVHLWRFYFRFQNADVNNLTESSRLNWEACDRSVKKFAKTEIDLLKQYYVTGYGKYEDMQAVEEFSKQNGIKQSEAWETIKRANYEVIVERGLMDRKEEDANGNPEHSYVQKERADQTVL